MRDVEDAGVGAGDPAVYRVLLLVMTVVLGVVYPVGVYAIGRVVPARADGSFVTTADGTVVGSRRWLAPVDFSCMGYAVPAAIGAKLANPKLRVVVISGDELHKEEMIKLDLHLVNKASTNWRDTLRAAMARAAKKMGC